MKIFAFCVNAVVNRVISSKWRKKGILFQLSYFWIKFNVWHFIEMTVLLNKIYSPCQLQRKQGLLIIWLIKIVHGYLEPLVVTVSKSVCALTICSLKKKLFHLLSFSLDSPCLNFFYLFLYLILWNGWMTTTIGEDNPICIRQDKNSHRVYIFSPCNYSHLNLQILIQIWSLQCVLYMYLSE